MELPTYTQPRWSSKGLLGLLRASLPPSTNPPAAGDEPAAAPGRLDSRDLSEVATRWRHRTAFGDLGAESVASALELVAARREQRKLARIQAVGRRLSALMQLDGGSK